MHLEHQRFFKTFKREFKGSVERKLGWVKNGGGLRLLHWAFFCRFIWISSWFYHISVSGQYCASYRRVLEK
jgi:hypothetical protein